MKPRLTARQNEAYEFIRLYMRTQRKPPTLKEIGSSLGIRSSNGVFKLLKALEKKGYIRREEHAARGLDLVDDGGDSFALDDDVPSLIVMSRTSSSDPGQIRKRPSAYLSVDPYLLRGTDEEACLIGRAGDDGMNGDGIRKGDLLLIEEMPWRQLSSGVITAFLVREELQARRFDFTNGRFHLRPADRTYAEETFAPNDPDCHPIGRVIALMRRMG